jgi:hypothetical protein
VYGQVSPPGDVVKPDQNHACKERPRARGAPSGMGISLKSETRRRNFLFFENLVFLFILTANCGSAF